MNAEDNTYSHKTCDGEKSDQRERSHSPDPSVWSLKSDKSMKMPIEFKNGFDQSSEERSSSPDPSVWSLKSEKSMKMPIEFKNVFDQSSEERSSSPDPSVWSLKSDKSMKMPIEFKDGNSLFHQSSLEKSHSPDPSVIQLPNNLRDETNLPHHRHDLQTHEPEIHKRLKSYVKTKYEYILDGLGKQGKPTLLTEIYTELYIIEGEAGEIRNKHEFTSIEKAFTAATATIAIKCNDIFRPLPGQDKPIRTVLTKGVAGIGKTVSVQKFILDWAEEKENQDVQLIFPLPFRELNLMKDKTLSLSDLLHVFFPETKEMEISSDKYKVLFIFDGLDECRLSLDFQSDVRLCDVSESASVDVLLTNLIAGNLLPSALIWITSRPAAADLVPSECVHRVTEVRGFNEPQKEEYFRKRISDQSLADRIISHLKSSRSLYIMCHIPVFCWISATVLEKMLSEAESGEIPKTLTQMYTHFLITQISIKHEKDYEKNVTDEDMILKLGKLAFQQLVKGNVIFYEEDLRECGINVTEASVYSGLCTQIFREEFGWYQGKVFCFVHLSIQEHLAALYVHLSFHNSNKNLLEAHESETPVTMLSLHKCAVKKAIESRNGHFELFLRFLMGLSLESNHRLLERFLVKTTISSLEREKTIEYLKQETKNQSCPNNCLILFHCLNELNDHSLINEIQSYLSCGKQNNHMSPKHLPALVCFLMTSNERTEEFTLQKYGRSDDSIEWLHPVIKSSTKARLNDCNITDKGCALLTTVLTSQSNVRELDLSHNNLQDSGVEILSVGVNRSTHGAALLKEIEKKKHKRVLAPKCGSHSQHKSLHEHGNKESLFHLHHGTAGLQDTECSLESLNVKNCGVTEAGCVSLSLALSLNPSHLKVLDLSWNKIGDSGVKHLCAALEKVQCALEILKLDKCGMTEKSCTALASALSSETSSLTHLDLSINDLQDSGVKKLCVGLHNPHCKLEKLGLSNCNVTHEGVASLTEALKSNPSLKEIDLLENDLEEADLNVLSKILEKTT
ncbi:NACHT, LRR and PYD domains-containing protein 3 [Pseudorasbora parva]|uniref:NACHT, LRR and PYD domains-containing protein 3 n=1 Tax=Pseudorasbora parva TaxID=51549 RepID=UPI00351EB329